MGADESSMPIGSNIVNINPVIPISDQITIAIHGKRKVGKTSLIQKMINMPLNRKYIPTPTMESIEFYWKSIRHPDETIKITVWDVVDSALKSINNSDIILPDAKTVDTLSTPDGIIVLYDPDIEDTVDYAISIIEKAPEKIPIICLANFLDRRKMVKEVLDKFNKLSERIIHVQTSMYSHRGLINVAEWLDVPLLYSREKHYMKCAEITSAEISEFDKKFIESLEKVAISLVQSDIEDDDDEFHPELVGNQSISFSSLSQNENITTKDFMIHLDYNE